MLLDAKKDQSRLVSIDKGNRYVEAVIIEVILWLSYEHLNFTTSMYLPNHKLDYLQELPQLHAIFPIN